MGVGPARGGEEVLPETTSRERILEGKNNEIGALLKQLWPQWQSRHTQQSIRLTGEPMDSADRGSQRQQSRQLGRLTDWLTRAQSCHWLPSPISATKFVPPCDDSAHMDILRSAAAKRLIGIK